MKELRDIVAHLCSSADPSVLVTLTSVRGSSYRRPGARMLVTEGGLRIGSISGGCLEEDLIERSRQVAASKRADVVTYDTSAENDLVWGVGLGCHGVIKILIEPLPPRPLWAEALSRNLFEGRSTFLESTWDTAAGTLGTRLVEGPLPGREAPVPGVFLDQVHPAPALTIFGAGDDARPLARIALELGWRVIVADPRPAMATPERFPGTLAQVLGPAEELVARASPPAGSLAIVMTHHYRHDVPLVRDLLPRPLAFLGLLGPRRRTERILDDLARGGLPITEAMRSRLHAPVGLDIGADAPEEVALSIVAEMRALLSGRDARPLRDRQLPIHA
jgi:xanthine/CO dehydrogenase XdhC/CoxF family maturation factor